MLSPADPVLRWIARVAFAAYVLDVAALVWFFYRFPELRHAAGF